MVWLNGIVQADSNFVDFFFFRNFNPLLLHDEHKTHVFMHIRQTLVMMVLVLVFVIPRTRTAPFDAANVPTSCTGK